MKMENMRYSNCVLFCGHETCPVLQVFIRQGSSPKGPLTAREIKERVTAEYEQVFHHMQCMGIFNVIKFSQDHQNTHVLNFHELLLGKSKNGATQIHS